MKCLVPLAAGIAVYCQAVSFLAPTRAFGRGSVGPMSIAGLAVADFNGDGKLDIVDIPGNRSGLSFPLLSLGNGDGTFRANVGSVGLASGLSSPVTADFDLDGRMDVATFSSSGLAVFLGNGDGTLRSPIFSAYLEKSSFRKTPERYAILEEIYDRTDHFDAEALYIDEGSSKDWREQNKKGNRGNRFFKL